MRSGIVTMLLMSAAMTLAFSSVALAHTTVSPEQASAGSTATFTVSTPVEKEIPIVEERVEVPQGFEIMSVNSPDGWQGAVEGDSVVWTGGEIPEGEEQQFAFTAQVPSQTGEYKWSVFDTYRDGSVSEWTGAPDSDNPASVTEVVAGEAQVGAGHGDDLGGGMQDDDLPETGGVPLAALASLLLAAGLGGLLLKRRLS